MFKNEFQGGLSVEIFSANGKDPLNKWKNPALKRDYEKEVKGFIFMLEGSTTTAKLCFPTKDAKHQSLGLIQRFLVLQVFVPLAKDFAVELTMTDIKNNKRRVVLSTSVRDISMTPLHAKLSLSLIKRDVWLNLSIDLVSLISDVFPSQTYKSLESFSMSGNCKIRRVFTLKSQPFDTIDTADDVNDRASCESIPQSLQFPNSVPFHTQVVSVAKIRQHLGPKSARGDVRDTSDYWSSSSDDLSSSRRFSARDQGPPHIAFGTKVPFDPYRSKQGASSARKERTTPWDSADNRSGRNSARKIRSSDPRLSRASNADKENTATRLEPSVQVAGPSLTSREAPHKFKALGGIVRRKAPDPIMSVAVTEKSQEGRTSARDADLQQPGNPDVYVFASLPRSAPKSRPQSVSPVSKGNKGFGDDFERLSVDSDTGNDNERRGVRRPNSRDDNFRTPRSNPLNDSLSRLVPNRSLAEPVSSMSPDISRLKSPQRVVYDSAKYTDGEKPSSVLSKKPPVGHSASLRASDATLTASVDTLVQSATRPEGELEDSLDDKLAPMRHVPLESDTSPPKSSSQQVLSGSRVSVSLRRTRIKELEIPNGGTAARSAPESSQYQMGEWSDSFEAQMLLSMQRDAEEEMCQEDAKNTIAEENAINYQDHYDDSFDASWSTYRNPPTMRHQDYDAEMRSNDPLLQNSNTLNGLTLMQSNPRDWANLLSPPTVFPSVIDKQKKESLSDVESVGNEMDSMGLSDGSSIVSVKSSNTGGDTTDDEEMLDLLYDPCLNCYFDPKTGKYYELKH